MRNLKNNSSAIGIASTLSIIFTILLASTPVYAQCPAPAAIHSQKIVPAKGNNRYYIESGAILVAEGMEKEWVSDSNLGISNDTVKLSRVEISSLERAERSLTCFYAVGDNAMMTFQLHEPSFEKSLGITLEDEKEWTPFLTYKDTKYGYACNTATSTTQCKWDYDR